MCIKYQHQVNKKTRYEWEKIFVIYITGKGLKS